jgi:arginyl-tRNA synthetase
MTLLQELESIFLITLKELLGVNISVIITPATDLRFGDYQCNVAMILAKEQKTNPRALAEKIIAVLNIDHLGSAEIAGPGFINIRLKPEVYAARITKFLQDEKWGVPITANPKTIVVDFSAPNVAKPMHVGHIRSTIIGDSLSRIARFLGHNVITDNHIGDWGTQFGMVTWAWKQGLDEVKLRESPLEELLRLYRHASDESKADPIIREACRHELVKLQNGDQENMEIWSRCLDLSKQGLNEIYDRLDVSFDHWFGESYYNSQLSPLVEKMLELGLAKESDGAICVFSNRDIEDFTKDPFLIRKEGEWVDFPMMIRKSDGAFNYATTDVATLEFRKKQWKADVIWYVVDHRQSLHFQQLFVVADRMNIADVDLRHVAFGTILGKDGKPLKTRAGDLPQLADVLDDAVAAAKIIVAERSRVETQDERDELAELMGVSAVKFTELSHHRLSDYVFDLDKMVALEGDTAPYLFYSYVRSRAIFRKLENPFQLSTKPIFFTEDAELCLARLLNRFGEILPSVLDDCRPNILTSYLLELARCFHSFFEACPVLKSGENIRYTRLVLCFVTAGILSKGLNLMGIKVPEKM